mgnify:CR=1 FL=1
MVNQNPQPEVYTTRHAFTTGASQGTNVTSQIFTNQAHNEEVRIYGLMVNIVVTATGNTVSATADEYFALIAGSCPTPTTTSGECGMDRCKCARNRRNRYSHFTL